MLEGEVFHRISNVVAAILHSVVNCVGPSVVRINTVGGLPVDRDETTR